MKELLFKFIDEDRDDDMFESTYESLTDKDYKMIVIGEYWAEVRISYQGKRLFTIVTDYITIPGITKNTIGCTFPMNGTYKLIVEDDKFISLEEVNNE